MIIIISVFSTLGVLIIGVGVSVLTMVIRRRRIAEYNKNTKLYYIKEGNDDKIYTENESYYTILDEDYKTEFLDSLKPEGSFMNHDLFSRTRPNNS